mmetsp:Transcript_93895/g.244573  ORF Transcript_93895/g.244573 Transcript_93895/m.244573 type:complete len:221 (-) Transcript_93895:343-1005(-)
MRQGHIRDRAVHVARDGHGPRVRRPHGRLVSRCHPLRPALRRVPLHAGEALQAAHESGHRARRVPAELRPRGGGAGHSAVHWRCGVPAGSTQPGPRDEALCERGPRLRLVQGGRGAGAARGVVLPQGGAVRRRARGCLRVLVRWVRRSDGPLGGQDAAGAAAEVLPSGHAQLLRRPAGRRQLRVVPGALGGEVSEVPKDSEVPEVSRWQTASSRTSSASL